MLYKIVRGMVPAINADEQLGTKDKLEPKHIKTVILQIL